jgi:hypothetical protein
MKVRCSSKRRRDRTAIHIHFADRYLGRCSAATTSAAIIKTLLMKSIKYSRAEHPHIYDREHNPETIALTSFRSITDYAALHCSSQAATE